MIKRLKNYILLVTIFSILVFNLYSEDGVAKVELIKGKVFVTFESGEKRDLKLKEILPVNSVIETKKNSKAVLLVKEIGKVELEENSILKLDKPYLQKLQTHLSLTKGSAKFKVSKLVKDEKLNVFTPTAVVGVRGTDYEIQIADDGSTAINVSDGIVNVKNEEKEIELNKNQSCESPVDSKNIMRENNPKNMQEWKKNKNSELKTAPVEKIKNIKNRLGETVESQEKISKEVVDENSAKTNIEEFRFNCAKSEGLFNAANNVVSSAPNNESVKNEFIEVSSLYSKIERMNKEIDEKFKKLDREYELKLKKIEKKFEEQEKKLEKKLEKYK